MAVSVASNIVILYRQKVVKASTGKRTGLIPLAICVPMGLIYTVANPDQWNYTDVTHWTVGGAFTAGPTTNFLTTLVVSVLLFAAASYVVANIVVHFAKNAKLRRANADTPKATLSPFTAVCYNCHQPKSTWSAYPSKICGVRICSDCLKQLGFDRLSTQDALDAFSGEGRFNSADEVIAELRRRQAA